MVKRRGKRLLQKNKRLLIVNSFLVLLLFLGVGFSLLSTDLNLFGSIKVKEYSEPTLYNVLKREARIGTYAKEYTGAHNDSMDTSLSTEKIFHWYASNDSAGNTKATEIQDKWNVLFAGHCWQMFRTTDTGGVKMIYNGEPENNQCLNNRGNHVGYVERTTQSLNTTYYYGTHYEYDKTNNIFSLNGTVTTGTIQTGQYTCKSTSSTGTCSTLYFVDNLNSGSNYYVYSLNGNSHYSQLGTVQFNQDSNSLADVGYLNKKRYTSGGKQPLNSSVYDLYYVNKTSNFYYGTGITYDSTTNKYTLTNITQNTWNNVYASASDLYTCKSETETSCTYVYYIVAGESNRIAGFELRNGNLVNYYNTDLILGTGYTENGGVYSLTNATAVSKLDWANTYNSYIDYYFCSDNTTTCSILNKMVSTNKTYYYTISTENNYIFSNSFTYNTNTNTYTLGNDTVEFWDPKVDNNLSKLNTHHYTCYNATGECSKISYIYTASMPDNSIYLHSIIIEGGKSIEDAINEMISDDDINQNNSAIKTAIDEWYKQKLLDYGDYLEDIIFCNDRRINNLAGWNSNGGNVADGTLLFERPDNDISCYNVTDKFSLSNTKAQLIYSIGLMTNAETKILNNSNINKTNETYWLITPSQYIVYYSKGIVVNQNGSYDFIGVNNKYGIRPVISLKPGTEYIRGTGSMNDPYIVDMS